VTNTIQVLGHINKRYVSVLVDEDSTHNFIQAKCPTLYLKVLVVSEEELTCSKICKEVKIIIQGHHFWVLWTMIRFLYH